MHRLLTVTFFGVGAMFFRGSLLASKVPSLMIGRTIVGLSSVLAGLSVRKEAANVKPEDPKEVYDVYMHLWKLFYLSYLVLPLASGIVRDPTSRSLLVEGHQKDTRSNIARCCASDVRQSQYPCDAKAERSSQMENGDGQLET
eukprot:scaffold14741_cov135-Cylindrotheca_fusiformis.AAC.4